MPRRLHRRAVFTCGLVVLLLGVGVALGDRPGAARAQDLPPRPTVAPTAAPEETDGGSPARPAAPGRITGTVIDQRTGAPATGVSVAVGETVVTSDVNGNYDLNGLTPGSYGVALRLADGQGQATQGETSVALAAGQTVVQHLFFRSPQPTTPQADPESEPAPEAVPTPAALPATGDAGQPLLVSVLAGLVSTCLGYALRRIRPSEPNRTA